MDVRMPQVDGVEAAKIIHEKNPDVKIIMLSTFDDSDYIYKSIKNGAVGYLLKEDIDAVELLDAIKAVISGSILFSHHIASKLITSDTGKEGSVNVFSKKKDCGMFQNILKCDIKVIYLHYQQTTNNIKIT